MVTEWRNAALGEVIELKRGYDLAQTQREPGTVPVITSSGQTGTHSVAKAKGPGVIIGRYGTLGRVFFVREDYWPHNTTLYVKDFKGNDPRFIRYLLETVNFEAYSDKAAVPGVNRNHVHLEVVKLPPLPEQRAIAHILGTLDDKIELNRRMNETLEAIARALFKSWFIDFDPVRAKMEGREPAGMDAETAALFPDSLVDSELGPIPEGWRVRAIGDVVRAVGGSTPSTKNPEFWDGSFGFATPKDLSSLHSPTLLSTERSITRAGLDQIGSGLLPAGTVLLSSRAPIGYLAITEFPVAINQGFIAMICDRELPKYYALYWAIHNMESIIGNANGTTFMEISRRNFRPIQVVAPPAPVLSGFVQYVEPVRQRVVQLEREIITLGDLRDALLPRLVSGEIRVENVDHFLEEHV